jgi:hypothetical protein
MGQDGRLEAARDAAYDIERDRMWHLIWTRRTTMGGLAALLAHCRANEGEAWFNEEWLQVRDWNIEAFFCASAGLPEPPMSNSVAGLAEEQESDGDAEDDDKETPFPVRPRLARPKNAGRFARSNPRRQPILIASTRGAFRDALFLRRSDLWRRLVCQFHERRIPLIIIARHWTALLKKLALPPANPASNKGFCPPGVFHLSRIGRDAAPSHAIHRSAGRVRQGRWNVIHLRRVASPVSVQHRYSSSRSCTEIPKKKSAGIRTEL